eukprot:12784765-Prorocentrum_lima.AAC.1
MNTPKTAQEYVPSVEVQTTCPKNAHDQEPVMAQSQKDPSLNQRHSPNLNPNCQRRVPVKTRHTPQQNGPNRPSPRIHRRERRVAVVVQTGRVKAKDI